MKKILLSLALLGSIAAAGAQTATNEPVAMAFSVKFDWSTNQTVALKALWREAIAGVTNPPTFGSWATAKIQAGMAGVLNMWEVRRQDRVRAELSTLIARLAASEPNAAQRLAISNLVVAAEAAQQ